MERLTFINLPVADLDASVDFFTKLGFSSDERFTDDAATMMIVSEQTSVMLLTHERFTRFTPKQICDTAIRMYGRSFEDLDGHTERSSGWTSKRPRPSREHDRSTPRHPRSVLHGLGSSGSVCLALVSGLLVMRVERSRSRV